MSGRHTGKVAVITGSAASIGQAYAKRLAEEGARIVVADIAPGDETIELVRSAGSDAIEVNCDVSAQEDVARLAEAVAEFGAADILVHNAAIYPFTTFDDMTFEEWRRVMSINLDGMFHLCKAFLPSMRARGWGRVIAMSSNTFHLGVPNTSHYVASKGGVIGFVRSLSGEVGVSGITVNAIAPSLTRTRGTSAGRQQELGIFELAVESQAIKRTEVPEDLVGTLSFLASEDAAFITGQTLLVDGGWSHH